MNTLFSRGEDLSIKARNESAPSSIYHTLLYTVFQRPRENDSGGIVVAVSSANPGEGVTYVSRALLYELGKCDLTSVAGVSVSFLRKLHEPTLEAIRKFVTASGAVTSGAPNDGARSESIAVRDRRGPWEGSWQYRRDCINLLRSEFDYTIIDCPSLKQSGDLLSVAPFVDGVILVIEANRTHRDKPRQAEQAIIAAGGKLLGYILNKRTNEIPDWLDRKL
jgi:ATPases involved in chromosome partitioning